MAPVPCRFPVPMVRSCTKCCVADLPCCVSLVRILQLFPGAGEVLDWAWLAVWAGLGEASLALPIFSHTRETLGKVRAPVDTPRPV
jgi:hypothetical protein